MVTIYDMMKVLIDLEKQKGPLSEEYKTLNMDKINLFLTYNVITPDQYGELAMMLTA